MSDAEAPRRRGLIEPTLFAICGVAALVALGVWQLDRKTWKEGLIATVTQRITAAPAALPPRERWAQLSADKDEYRRVTFPAEFIDDEALVYTAGSAFRPDVSGAGFWVFSPVRLLGGSVVVVNRGFVPTDHRNVRDRPNGMLRGIVDITGAMRWPEARGLFTPADEPQNGVWYVRDPKLIAEAKHWGAVAPFFIDMEAPQPPGGMPRPGPLVVKLPDNHLQYAITWFGLAAALIGVYVAWLIARRRASL
ncbi:MAG TPA: SURF1 family protein [Pseudolabrys sp.]|nr:SURF1 family protein [Pseudolabrys sp.]